MRFASLAVVIGFRDWGLERLGVAVQRIANSSIGSDLDIVVSDFGSVEEESVRAVVSEAGGRVVRSGRHGPWSRARALNAGVRATAAKFVVTTDADMIFSHHAAERTLALLRSDVNTVQLVQCRDLTQAFDWNSASQSDDATLEANSYFRPRWGMGGFIAFRRADFDLVGGYDERMEIYGGEDIDFAQRLIRCGRRINWIDEEDLRIYHIWHPSTREIVRRNPGQLAAQERNRQILLEDKTWIRNLNIVGRANPVVSVLIATHNRGRYISDSINSVLNQTIQDFELIVADDGSTDDTSEVLASVDDPRVRLLRHDNAGVAFTRNRLVSEARSSLLIVHDDDDIMLPWRIDAQLSAMCADVIGTYGGWVDFDNDTGDTEVVPGKQFSASAFMYTGKILAHGTSLFRKEILQKFPYREHLRAGVDFNLIVRLANSGYRMRHTGQLHILRRMHGLNLTTTVSSHQKNAATRTVAALRRKNNVEEEARLRNEARSLANVEVGSAEDLTSSVLIYLPDHLVKRKIEFSRELDSAVGSLLKSKFGDRLERGDGWEDGRVHIVDARLCELPLIRQLVDTEFTVSRVRNNGRNSLDKQIADALCKEGSLADDKYHVIRIREGRENTSEPDAKFRKRRYWRNGQTTYIVDIALAADLDAAISILNPLAGAISLLIAPTNSLHSRKGVAK